jgi:hypothetical protein
VLVGGHVRGDRVVGHDGPVADKLVGRRVVVLGSILRNGFGRNLRIKPNLV